MTVDDAPWLWADASGEPVVLNGLSPGPHKIRLDWKPRTTNCLIKAP